LGPCHTGGVNITAYEYDDYDRVVEIDYNYPSFSLPISISTPDVTYEYDDDNALSSRIETIGIHESLLGEDVEGDYLYESYDYDDFGRLISYTPALPANYGSITYTYNLAGLKTSMTVPMGMTGTNNARKYIYNYDKSGKMISQGVVPATVTSSATLAGNQGTTSSTRFYYDNSKNRVKLITKSGDVYYYVYDPTASTPAVVYEAMRVNTSTVRIYLNEREPDGSLIGRDKYVNGGLVYTRKYHFDGLGSTIALTDGGGTTTDTYSYDEWGNVTPGQYNQTDDNPYQYVGQFGYYTHYQEPTLNLLQLGERYYDPTTGRFTQIDRLAKDEVSAYVYADSSPIIQIDPSGLRCHHVNPSHTTNYIGKCLAEAKKCLPPEFQWGDLWREIDNSRFYVCDGIGSNNGETYCGAFWKGRCDIKIWPQNSSTNCGSVLHELMHARFWPKYRSERDPEHLKLSNAAQNAWNYYCDKSSACYGSKPPEIGGLQDDIYYFFGVQTIRAAR